MWQPKPFAFRWTIPPGNSQFVIPFDSTRGTANMSYASLAAGSAYLAPGLWRARFGGCVYWYTVRCTTQNVTGDEQLLTGNAGTSADWESQGALGTYTVTAGTTAVREFKPLAPDHRILITAGATGPATIIVQGELIYAPKPAG